MSEIHKFLFEGMPVRGVLVRLTDAWQEILRRRTSNTQHGAYPQPLQNLLGEMTAAAVLMQSNIKFDGSLVLQIFGDGPVKLAVVEVQPDFGLRATATLQGGVDADATLGQMVNPGGQGRCAITLDPKQRQPGQQPYQGVVPLHGPGGEALERFSDVLQHYMRQSEQLDTTLVLAADEHVAAGLLIQRLPIQGTANLAGSNVAGAATPDTDEDYRRIALLASSLQRDELLGLDADTVLHRLFWEEPLLRFEPRQGAAGPHFSCTCSHARVGRMIESLGSAEAEAIVRERGEIEVACEFCSAQYRFDAVDVEQLFRPPATQPPGSGSLH